MKTVGCLLIIITSVISDHSRATCEEKRYVYGHVLQSGNFRFVLIRLCSFTLRMEEMSRIMTKPKNELCARRSMCDFLRHTGISGLAKFLYGII